MLLLPEGLFAACLMLSANGAEALPNIAELLGYEPTDRLLIINADDLGMSHATNLAVFDAFERGVLTSATVMMPTAWVKEVALWAQDHPEADIGIHLTHTSEWKLYRWGPVAGRSVVPGLVGPDGYLWPDCAQLWAHATPGEAETEARAQIELALKMGLDPTHLDSHMGALQLDPEFWQVYLKLSVEYRLPQRQASRELYNMLGAEGRKEAERAAGVLGPDVLIYGIPEPDDVSQVPQHYERILRNLRPGLSELYLHPAIDGPEMQAICGSHARRDADYQWLINPATGQLINDLGIKLIGYRELRDAMRRGVGVQR